MNFSVSEKVIECHVTVYNTVLFKVKAKVTKPQTSKYFYF